MYRRHRQFLVTDHDDPICTAHQIAGVANKRLYELRMQAPEKSFGKDEALLRQIVGSFRLLDLELPPQPEESEAA